MNLPKYSLDHPKVIYFFLAILLIGGISAFDKLEKKEDAPFVIKQVSLITTYPGATPAEVEELITEPIERTIQSMRNVYKIKSESQFGLSKIDVELVPSLPPSIIPQMWDELRRKTMDVQPSLPAEASTIKVADDFGDVFGIYYALVGSDGFEYNELREWANKIKTQIVTIDGVEKVALFGEQIEVINVFIPTSKLANLGLNLNMMLQTLQTQNTLINTGDKAAGDLQIKIIAEGTYKSLDDLKNQILVTNTGQQVRMGDIAEITKGYMDPPNNLMRVNGKRAIGIGVSTASGKDVALTGELVRQKLQEK